MVTSATLWRKKEKRTTEKRETETMSGVKLKVDVENESLSSMIRGGGRSRGGGGGLSGEDLVGSGVHLLTRESPTFCIWTREGEDR